MAPSASKKTYLGETAGESFEGTEESNVIPNSWSMGDFFARKTQTKKNELVARPDISVTWW